MFVYSSTKAPCDVIESTCESYIAVSNVTRTGIIVFRGSHNKLQIFLEGLQSYTAGTEFIGMGRVGPYFLQGHEKLWPAIVMFLKAPEFKEFNIIVTGHSLGAALASLTAARIVKEGHRPASKVKLYTFGQPRTGSYNYAMAFDALGFESYRVNYAADVTSHQPPCEKDQNTPVNGDGSRPCLASASNEAYHHGTEIWYPKSMTPGNSYYIECLGSPKNEDMECSDMLSFQSENMDAYFWDHRHYFDFFVTGFGQSGCSNRTLGQAPAERTTFAKYLSKPIETVRNIGLIFIIAKQSMKHKHNL